MISDLVNPTWSSNHQFTARLFGVSGQTNVVLASTNLTTWIPILTNSAGIYDFADPAFPADRYRFYRASLSQ